MNIRAHIGTDFQKTAGKLSPVLLHSSKSRFICMLKAQLDRNEIDHLEAAEMIARFVHAGEFRRSGEDYFEHVLRVAKPHIYFPQLNIAESVNGMITGYLHDVFEKKFPNPDDNWHIDDLRFLQFDNDCIDDLIALTKETGEPYLNYSMRVTNRHMATEKKFVDTLDNNKDNPSESRQKLYGITIPYYLATLNEAIPPGHDIVQFAHEIRKYDAEIFARYYVPPVITTNGQEYHP